MATAVESVAGREKSLSRRFLRLTLLEPWHLLSLDAPTVAALWSWFFARTMQIHLPWHAPLILAIGTWLVYVADRILDGYTTDQLRARHEFHARHRSTFLGAALLAGCVLLWLICTRMTANARLEDTVLFLIALLYLFLVHKRRDASRAGLPKELAVGIVFAAATVVPAWSRLSSGHLALCPAVFIFAVLCWLNCVAIECWESLPSPSRFTNSHATTVWAAHRLRTVAVSFAAITLTLGAVIANCHQPWAIYIAAGLSGLLLSIIDAHRRRLSTMALRIAADTALLTPLLFLPFIG